MNSMTERVSEKTKKFYEETAVEAFNLASEIEDEVMAALAIFALSDSEALVRLESKLARREKLKIAKYFGKDIFSKYPDMTPRMKSAFVSALKLTGRKTVLDTALGNVKSDVKIEEFFRIKGLNLPDRLKEYLLQSRICYWMKLYEASIVMVARVTEFTLKNYFRENKIDFKENDNLGSLEKIYGEHPKKNERILKYVIEVNRLDRNISSHDNPRRMDIEEANHAWTAVIVILKEIFGIKI